MAPKKSKPVRLKDAWDTPVDALFFHPGQDPGLGFLDTADWLWRAVPLGRISGVAASSFEPINARTSRHIDFHTKKRAFSSAIEFNTLPALVQDLSADGGQFAIGQKWLLNGASGTRIRNRMIWKNADTRPDFDAEAVEHLAQIQASAPASLPVATPPEQPTDYVIDCRNFFAFYHVISETLPHLCLAEILPNLGRIHLCSGKSIEAGFVMRWIEAFFPEIADRVELHQTPQHFERAYIPMNTRHMYYQTSAAVMPEFHDLAPDGFRFYGRRAIRAILGVVAMNSYDANLARFRERALARAATIDTSHLPRKFWVSRVGGGARDRTMRGQKQMIQELRKRGFEEVFFETLSPLEQVAIMHNAEVMISYHGAGFANMMFAGPDTYCIELGTLQTALYRWQDFMPHAHVSGCRYVSFYVDFKQPDPAEIPPLRSNNLITVALLPESRKQVLEFVDTLGEAPPTLSRESLMRCAKILQQSEDWPRLDALLAAHPEAAKSDPEILAIQARQLERMGDLGAAVAHLRRAWELDQSRPFLLERLIFTTEIYGHMPMVRDLRAVHLDLFPDRHPDLVKRIRRMRHRKRLEAEKAAQDDPTSD